MHARAHHPSPLDVGRGGLEPSSPKLHSQPNPGRAWAHFAWAQSVALRNSSVPLPVLIVVASLAFLTGNWLHTMEDLPSPGGPALVTSAMPSAAGTGRRSLLLDSSGHKAASARINPLQSEEFETHALSGSGFDVVRPALPTAQSGDANMRVVPFQTISWYPRITYYPGFVDKARCEHIMALAKRHMSPSALAYRPGESIPETQEVRTSSGTFLSREMDRDKGVLAWLEERIASVTHLPVENGEAFNCLRYLPTQHYDSHYDSFSPDQYGPQPSQRIATFLLFLSDVEEGGETVFKREGRPNGNRTIADWRGCDDGLGVKVKPRQGDAVLFWSTRPNLELDDHALHGACPVVKGEKWSIAKWIHEKPLRAPVH